MDIDDKVALLSELFPDARLEFILNALLNCDGDLEMAMSTILKNDSDLQISPFDHLITTFPDVEVESIEAFLLINSHDDLDSLTRDFMKHFQQTPKKPRDRNLKMNLSDFNSLLRTSKDKIPTFRKRYFNFTCKLPYFTIINF